MSAVATKYLAPKSAKTMAMIGNRTRSEFQTLAMKSICGITTVQLYDIDPSATEKAARNLAHSGLNVIPCDSREQAIEGADIITTCTADKQCAEILTDNMVGSGVYINAIGGDCPGKTESQRDDLLRSGIFVEYPAQTRIESEIQQLEPDHPVTELWQVFTGQSVGQLTAKQITAFDSVGFDIEDFSALRYVREQAENTTFVQPLDLSADPDDPRDIFAMLQRARPQRPTLEIVRTPQAIFCHLFIQRAARQAKFIHYTQNIAFFAPHRIINQHPLKRLNIFFQWLAICGHDSRHRF